MTRYTFIGPLRIEWVGERSWRLLAPLSVKRDGVPWVTLPAGFVTNFMSTPPFLWSFFDPENPCWLLPSLVHDYLYDTTCTITVTRKEADDFLRDAGAGEGCGYSRYIIWAGVRLFGSTYWHSA